MKDNKMPLTIPYGCDELSIALPNDNVCEILGPKTENSCVDAIREIENALLEPIGSPQISGIVKPGDRVNIICDDITRPTPVSLILPIVVTHLLRAGIAEKDIKIVMALGSHRYMTDAEMRDRVGEDIYRRFKVVNSEFKRAVDLLELGKAADGTRILMSKTAMDSGIRIAIGNIAPHPTMGWGGGGKILFPGVAGEATVAAFHSRDGFVDENQYGKTTTPVRDMVENWVGIVGLHFIINTILTLTGDIYRVVAGHYVAAHRAGVAHARESLGVAIKEPADIVIVSSYPLDSDCWQSSKAMYAAEHAAKADGMIIHVSPNKEGVGPHSMYPIYLSMEEPVPLFEQAYRGERHVEDMLALACAVQDWRLLRRKRVTFVSDGVSGADFPGREAAYYPSSELQNIINRCLSENPRAKVSIITHGGETVPYSAGSNI